ncbi:MAG: hypothetical protein ACJ72V_06840 [Nitrososphaeraceae archaeon]
MVMLGQLPLASAAEPLAHVVCDIYGGRAFEDNGFSFGLLARHLLSIRELKRHK